MVNVTKTFLPPQAEYQAILKEAWDAGWITNRGTLVKRLEDQLKEYLEVPRVIVMTNGTLPLQIAIKALGLSGEIITTPFSYVATTSSIVWEGCTPVFVDIHPEYLTIDENKIEAAITSETSAILATHVFGNPCAIVEIEEIAKKHNLKVIYDAAHCFGVVYKGKSIFNYGDVSTCSFHATKLFHTGEGGAIFANDDNLINKLYYHHNFGHAGPYSIDSLGINAKMSELQAAMGLAVFPYLEQIIKARQEVCEFYDTNLDFNKLSKIKIRPEVQWNYSYYPVIFESEEILNKVVLELNENKIFPRRYFYPSLETLPYVESYSCNIANNVSECVLCLPLFHDLPVNSLMEIVNIVNNNV